MKRIFAERARIVCYVEASDVGQMLIRARENGQVLSEWTREVLLEASKDGGVVQPRSPKTPARRAARVEPSISELQRPVIGQSVCEHGATAYNCKKWGCKFYEIANGRG